MWKVNESRCQVLRHFTDNIMNTFVKDLSGLSFNFNKLLFYALKSSYFKSKAEHLSIFDSKVDELAKMDK